MRLLPLMLSWYVPVPLSVTLPAMWKSVVPPVEACAIVPLLVIVPVRVVEDPFWPVTVPVGFIVTPLIVALPLLTTCPSRLPPLIVAPLICTTEPLRPSIRPLLLNVPISANVPPLASITAPASLVTGVVGAIVSPAD